MYYIMDALSRSSSIVDPSLQSVLTCAVGVIMIFAVIFLFYTNSFLIKRRKKEIGVYNILGMGKRHIAQMLAVETVVTAVISIGAGLAFGIIFSKFMYLALIKLLHYDVQMDFEISGKSIRYTLILFVIIFLMTLVFNLFQIQVSNPVELLHGGNQGEKEPKTKRIMTVFGVIMLGVGYYIALTVEQPLAAIQAFFAAVVCVILGTYALFTSGSIAILKGLRKNKKFYYQAKNFSAVSGMIYRMKQNAVGLANICILSTMVLVMISTTISLYVGMEDVLKTRYPREFEAKTNISAPETDQALDRIIEEEMANAGVEAKSELRYHDGSVTAVRQEDGFQLLQFGNYAQEGMTQIRWIPLEDYNRMEGEEGSLAPDEVYAYGTGEDWGRDTVRIGDMTYHVVKELKNLQAAPKGEEDMVDSYFFIVSDAGQIQEILENLYKDSGMQEDWVEQVSAINYRVVFDLEGEEEDCLNAMRAMESRIESEVDAAFCESRELSREEFYYLYGGLFFIGIYLGALFLMATVLIMYYKQISEGYEDMQSYAIMQKVGMSGEEIRSTVHKQILFVFGLPLVGALVHTLAGMFMVKQLMVMIGFFDTGLMIECAVGVSVVFMLIYVISYWRTARTYYRIVNRTAA